MYYKSEYIDEPFRVFCRNCTEELIDGYQFVEF